MRAATGSNPAIHPPSVVGRAGSSCPLGAPEVTPAARERPGVRTTEVSAPWSKPEYHGDPSPKVSLIYSIHLRSAR
jgi:hypothetical protein